MKLSRRAFIRIGVYSTIAAAGAYPIFVESEWLVIKEIAAGENGIGRRVVHITDMHYKGDGAYMEGVVERINGLHPDIVCYTGDTVEDHRYLGDALGFIRKIRCPVFGVPGNHDHSGNAPTAGMKEAFQKTGGDWLVNENVRLPGMGLEILGANGFRTAFIARSNEGRDPNLKRILLVHYPKYADEIGNAKLDMILAGHSHGGQVRVPFMGALVLPPGVGQYDKGLFHTPAGPLYVNPGIGTYALPVRFNCRPEITVLNV